MNRRLFNLLTRTSLTLCISSAIVAVLMTDHWETGPIAHPIVGRWRYRLDGWFGHLSLILYHDAPTPNVAPPFAPNAGGEFAPFTYTPAVLAWCNTLPPGVHFGYGGYGFHHGVALEINRTRSWVALGKYTGVGIDLWPLVALFAILPIARWLHYDRVKRLVRRGVCLACGYDLRATPERCPECGSRAGAISADAIARLRAN